MTTLHSFLTTIPASAIPPLSHLLHGRKVDIRAYETSIPFLTAVPKQMLVFFLGISNVAKYMSTHHDGSQALYMSQEHCEYIGLKVVIGWMQKACKSRNPAAIQELNLKPGNSASVACSISRALRVLGCRADAARIDMSIHSVYFSRSLEPVEVRDLWRTLPRSCRYVSWMLENVRKTLRNPNAEQVSESLWQDMVVCVMGDWKLHDAVDEVEKSILDPSGKENEKTAKKEQGFEVEKEEEKEEEEETMWMSDGELAEYEKTLRLSSTEDGESILEEGSDTRSSVSLVKARGHFEEEEGREQGAGEDVVHGDPGQWVSDVEVDD